MPGEIEHVLGFSSIQQHLTAMTTAQTDFAKSSFEASKAYFEKLAAEKSPDKFTELTAEHAKSAQEMFFAEATKIGELYRTFAQEAFRPINSSFLPIVNLDLHDYSVERNVSAGALCFDRIQAGFFSSSKKNCCKA